MKIQTKDLRNVCLLGHSGCGKTSLIEVMLYESGALSRIGTIDQKNTASDFTNIEKERGHSLFNTLEHVFWRKNKINIIDTPGLDDFIGEVFSALHVADTGLLVLNASSGVEVSSELIWERLNKKQIPTLLVINQLDNSKSNFDNTLDQAKERFGKGVIEIQKPVQEGDSFHQIVDALRMVMYTFPSEGGKPEKSEIPKEFLEWAKSTHNELVEIAAEHEEGLMEKFFEEGTLSESDLAEGLKIAMINHDFFPVFCTSATKNMGTGRIMGFIDDICPSPADRNTAHDSDGNVVVCDSNADSSIFIYKTMTEPKTGTVSYFKVFKGVINSGDELEVPSSRNSVRLSQIYVSNGKNRSNVSQLVAGDLGCALKLKDVHTNQTLNQNGDSIEIEKIEFPTHRTRMAVEPKSANEMEKLMRALLIVAEEDPTLVVEQSATLKQTILHAQGQLHLDLIKYRIEKTNNVSMNFVAPKIPYRETITRMAEGQYRHKKQSGGAGQFAEVHMRIEPYYEGMPDPDGLSVRKTELEELPWGGKFSFLWCIVGGSIDAKYINAIKKGVMQKMEEGPLTGSPCLDIRVSIFDGKMHPVDSNDMAFMLASSKVFSDNFQNAKPELHEPIQELEVTCPEDVVGDIMGDLQSRRAIIMGIEAEGHYQKLKARVPLAELHKYSSTLRSIAHGKAKFTMKFYSFEKTSHDIQEKLVAMPT